MKWITLYDKIGRQPVRHTGHDDVYAIVENSITGQREKIYLTVKYDNNGYIFLATEDNRRKEYE